MRSKADFRLVPVLPTTEAGRAELAGLVSEVQAAAAERRIRALPCPKREKLALLDAAMEQLKKRSVERT